ncbi:hypothetical protein [Streptomyces sp. NBC_00083]|uniref:hypothetical protein n=1 Tax=Streptomyces sp. NBC_00083 TaxID=2975647 RepID=UPI00224FD258|nr:hypothetical protein [Streptomyces sp. NBC_00083]MCX5386800.1 hypothetical protein [Streptomyces sp. NBC_00083]
MRLHHTPGAAAGAFMLALALPSSAQAAAHGELLYTTQAGAPGGIHDPESGQCLDLPGTTGAAPAQAPKNHTNATATVFLDADCAGDTYYVLQPSQQRGTDVKFRSVVFS